MSKRWKMLVLVSGLAFGVIQQSFAEGCGNWLHCMNAPVSDRGDSYSRTQLALNQYQTNWGVHNSYNSYNSYRSTNTANSTSYMIADPDQLAATQTFTFDGAFWRDQYSPYDPRYMPKTIKPIGKRLFVFSPKTREWGAYDESGQLLAFGRANGGSSYCEELHSPCRTPRGVYHVYSKGSSSCISHTFPLGKGGAKMPYCMFFNKGYSIHGSPYLSLHNGSHGCIRVTVGAAKWLSSHFIKMGTSVLILPY